MTARPTWVLADPHGGDGSAGDGTLLALLEVAARRQVDLLIMGDLFLAWIGHPRFWTPFQAEVMAGIRAVREAGGRTRFVVGNRDYLVKENLQGSHFDVVYEAETVDDVGGEPTLLLHGDTVNPEDVRYLAWRRLSRSAPVSAALARLPGRIGQQLALRTERRMAGLPNAYKTAELPRAHLDALGARARYAGAARAIVGHFHHDAQWTPKGGVPVIVAPGWVDHRRILVANGAELVSTPAEQILGEPGSSGADVR